MNPLVRTEEELLAAASEGALVLTATRRLARRLRLLFDRRQAAAGCRAWLAPAIHSGDAWLQQTADRLGEGWRLLAPAPARRLWETIIEADGAGSVQALLQGSATARAAEEAHQLLNEFGGDPEDYPLAADHGAFLRWRRMYCHRLQKEGWLDRSTLPEIAAKGIEGGQLRIPAHVIFAGFDDLPPRFRHLAQVLTEQGAKCREIPFSTPAHGTVVRLPCADIRDEVRQAACWARHLLETGEGEIGIIVPDLKNCRSLIERVFREEIDPAAQVRPGAEETRFNLSLGEPLAGKGAIVAALEILSAGWRLTLAQAGFLLRTPYLGGALVEAALRARLDGKLRQAGEPQLSLQHIKTQAGGRSDAEDPRHAHFGQICAVLLATLNDRRERLPGAWATHFAALLQAVGWPGERPLDSLDYQVVKAFREKVLPQLAAFDPLTGPVGRSEAFSLLRRLAAETEFQPEGVESPVQVVGLLEAAGLRFRHLWVLGLHDGILPAPVRPNPFLPVAMQVAAGMPHADAEREAVFARQIAGRLFATGDSVILSYPLRDGDTDLLPSPYIRYLPVAALPPVASQAPAILWRQHAPPIETLSDTAGPPLVADERVGGGTAILRDQALCPFRSFVRHRLAAATLESPDIGLDPRARGSLLHKVMEIFWRQTGSQQNLLVLSDEERGQRIDASIEMAINDLHPDAGDGMLSLLLDLEKQRLGRVVQDWLRLAEEARPPFVVLAEEKQGTGSFGGLSFATRIDRIDRLDDGRRVLLDYKTGKVDAGDLLGERLLEPQLPMYALGREGEGVAAVAFASFADKKKAFHGVAADGDILPKLKGIGDLKTAEESGLDWPGLLVRWRTQLDALGRAFTAGEAAVDPVNFKKACRYCDLMSLCRSGEAVDLDEGGEE